MAYDKFDLRRAEKEISGVIMKVDYLIIGCGASAMAFLDVMLRETEATFAVVDKNLAPGGHWNHAYPFVRLHQPSNYYGVPSRNLGRDRLDTTGFNAGLFELASGVEVAAYFHDIMQTDFLPTGRVNYFPMTEYREDGTLVSLISGEITQIEITRKLVDGRRFDTQIPLTHKRKFKVENGVTCIPPNDLPRYVEGRSGFTILGAGKTAMDSILWLLELGAEPDSITWVRPRDSWLLNRKHTQPGGDFFDETIGGYTRELEIMASAKSVEELCLAMEDAGLWLRFDEDKWPTMIHGATTSEAECAQLKRVKNVVQAGHVRRIESNQMVMENSVVVTKPEQLYIDCTAVALNGTKPDLEPIFSLGRINLQMIRLYQPTFSAALIGHIEASLDDDELIQSATHVTQMTDSVEDWLEQRLVGMKNQYAWGQCDTISNWIKNCRLDAFSSTMASLDPNDQDKMAIVERLRRATPKAVENVSRLLS